MPRCFRFSRLSLFGGLLLVVTSFMAFSKSRVLASAYIPSSHQQNVYINRQQQQRQEPWTASGGSPFTTGNPSSTSSSSRSSSYSALSIRGGQQLQKRVIIPTAKTMKDLMVLNLGTNPALASLVAGSIAGAIGVGVAFPLDSLKTKSQVIRSTQAVSNTHKPLAHMNDPSSASAASVPLVDVDNMNMLQLANLIYQTEGIAGFFGGVKGMMVGQALIKSVAFSANAVALTWLQQSDLLPATVALVLAAMYSGFVTSFLVAPVERIKVMMQADSTKYANEIQCAKAIVQASGISGLFLRGLGPTLAREVPSYGIYFFVYGFLMTTPIAEWLGAAAPLVFGALTGMACWVPVYPIDVVKTLVQNSDGSDGSDESSWKVAQNLYQQRGISGFFDGLTPKMLRAAVNHSVTFFVYDLVLQWLQQGVDV